jgi:hypothetical protein
MNEHPRIYDDFPVEPPGVFCPVGEPAPEGAKRRFPLVAFDQIIAGESGSYLVKGLLQRKGLAVFWGPPKCGKSFFVFDLMMHVALGREYRGHRVKQGTVVYCVLEGAHGFSARVEAFRQKNLTEDDVSPPFYIMAASLNLIADYNSFVAEIRAQLGNEPPAVVVIDTLNRSLVGSENDDKDMAAYIRASDAIRDAFSCLVAIVHHCGHNGERPRGHSSLIGALDVQVAIWRDKSTNNVVAELEHNKDGETGLKLVSRLEVVEIGLDEDGDAITSLVVIPLEDAKPSRQIDEKAKRTPPVSAALLFDSIREAIHECGEECRPYNDGPSVRGVDEKPVRRIYYAKVADRALPGEDPEKLEQRREKSFQRAIKSALDKKFLVATTRDGSRFVWLP